VSVWRLNGRRLPVVAEAVISTRERNRSSGGPWWSTACALSIVGCVNISDENAATPVDPGLDASPPDALAHVPEADVFAWGDAGGESAPSNTSDAPANSLREAAVDSSPEGGHQGRRGQVPRRCPFRVRARRRSTSVYPYQKLSKRAAWIPTIRPSSPPKSFPTR